MRGWLRRFAIRASAIREHFTAWAYVLGPVRTRASAGARAFCDAVEAIGVAGALDTVAVRRFGPRSACSLASLLTAGRPLCNTSSPCGTAPDPLVARHHDVPRPLAEATIHWLVKVADLGGGPSQEVRKGRLRTQGRLPAPTGYH